MRCASSALYNDYLTRFPKQNGKYVVVTGCTSGTGQIFARTSAELGATVIMINRNSPRVDALKEQMKKEVPNAEADGRLIYIEGDLQNFESVNEAITKIKEKCTSTGIDILMNNAGVMALEDKATMDGYDVQMQTNHLSHFLLTKELYPLLLTAVDNRGDAAVINMSSFARRGGPLKVEYFGKNGGNLGGNGNSMFFGGARWERYHQTKLANIVFTMALHDKLHASSYDKAKKVRSLCATPGFSKTGLQQTAGKSGGGISGDSFSMKFAQSAEDGTLPILVCAFGTTDGGIPSSGECWEPANRMHTVGPPKKSKPGKHADDSKMKDLLWEESEKACGAFKV